MTALDCPKMEKYAQERAKGKTQIDAYVAAGFSGVSDGTACRYEKGNARIATRIEELIEDASRTAAERLGLDHEWWLKEMMKNSNMSRELEQMGASNVALNSIGKHLKVYDDSETDGGSGLIINIGGKDE